MHISRRAHIWILLAAILGLCALRAIWPADVQWEVDEPQLIEHALQGNQQHRLVTVGLMGTRGRPYGPVPTWIYQAMLLVTHDPRALVMMRGILCSLATAAALVSLAKSLRLPVGFVIVVLCSPYLWFYDRTLWDNSFNIPLSAAALAGYASFLRSRSIIALHVAIACLLIMPLVHLMAMIIVIPLALHLVLFRWRQVGRWWITISMMLALAILATMPYWREAASSAGVELPARKLIDCILALRGFEHVSGIGIYELLGKMWVWGWNAWPGYFFDAIRSPSGLIYLFGIVGIARVIGRRDINLMIRVGRICVAIVVVQVFVAWWQSAADNAHYFNASWIAFCVLAWIGVDALWRIRIGRALVILQGASVAATLMFVILRMHLTAGTRDIVPYGMALGEQMKIASELDRHGPGTKLICFPPQQNFFPFELRVLRELSGQVNRDAAPAEVVVRYASKDICDSHIRMEAHEMNR